MLLLVTKKEKVGLAEKVTFGEKSFLKKAVRFLNGFGKQMHAFFKSKK